MKRLLPILAVVFILAIAFSSCTTQKKYGCPSAVGDNTTPTEVENNA